MYRRLGSHPSSVDSASGISGLLKSSVSVILLNIKQLKLILLTALIAFGIFSFTLPGSSISAKLDALNHHPLYYAATSNNSTDPMYIRESPPKMNKKSFKSIHNRLKFFFPYDGEQEVENNIWQLWKYRADNPNFPEECFKHMERWRLVNSEYNHNVITIDEAEQQVFNIFSYEMTEVIEAYNILPDIRLKFEFLKYLLIYTSGGVYADIDTLDATPVKFWHHSSLKQNRVMVGVDVDYNDVNWDILYNRRLSFSTKIFQAKSHHPFFTKLIARIVYTILNHKEDILSIDWNEAFKNVDSNNEPLTQLLSESIFTDTLFEYLNGLDNPIVHRVARTEKDLIPTEIFGPETDQVFSYKLFTLSKGPTQIDDILVMPQITFRGPSSGQHKGQINKNSYENEYNDEKPEDYYYARPLHFLSWDSLLSHEQ